MLLCQEMSQMPPMEAEVMAMMQVVIYQGTDAVRSAVVAAQVIVALWAIGLSCEPYCNRLPMRRAWRRG